MDLIFVITRKCNLNCEHCPVELGGGELSLENAKKTIDIISKKNKKGNLTRIRFFGGEPFLFLDKIKKIAEYAEVKLSKTIFFDVTTNGSLLTSDALAYFSKKDNFELIISYHKKLFNSGVKKFFKELKYFKNCTFNIKIEPKKVESLSKDFIYLHSNGVSRFNLLPSYYVGWDKADIARLILEFQKIILYIKIQGVQNFYLKNVDVLGDVPLFNTAIVVDCDGGVYSNNIVLDGRLKNRKIFFLGSIDDDIDFKKLIEVKNGLEKSLIASFSKEVIDSTILVDNALTTFVLNFRNIVRYEKNNR